MNVDVVDVDDVECCSMSQKNVDVELFVSCFACLANGHVGLPSLLCEAGFQGGSSSDQSLADELEAKYGSFLRRFRHHQFLHLGASSWTLA